MLKDCILVIAGIMVFMIPAILQKGRRSQLKNDFPCQLSKMAVLSGLFVSIVELVVLIADLENILGQNGKELFSISSTGFFIMIFVKFRPALLGILIKLILYPFSSKNINDLGNAIKIATFNMQNAIKDFKVIELDHYYAELSRIESDTEANAQISDDLWETVIRDKNISEFN